jgi:hypothetical protein
MPLYRLTANDQGARKAWLLRQMVPVAKTQKGPGGRTATGRMENF